MNRTVVLAVDANPDYLYFAPLAVAAWNSFGWHVRLLYVDAAPGPLARWVLDATSSRSGSAVSIHFLDPEAAPLRAYRRDTVTQVCRLFAPLLLDPATLVMTGDIDLLPLSNYWNPSPEEITVYGFDLTNFHQVPMCYVAARASRWLQIMNVAPDTDLTTATAAALDACPRAAGQDFDSYWYTDQHLLTEHLNNQPVILVNRHFTGGLRRGRTLARGRVDRANWDASLRNAAAHPVDAHMLRQVHLHPDRYEKTKQFLNQFLPKLATWYPAYHNAFVAALAQPLPHLLGR